MSRIGTDAAGYVFQSALETVATFAALYDVPAAVSGGHTKAILRIGNNGAAASFGQPTGVTLGGVACTLRTGTFASAISGANEVACSIWFIDNPTVADNQDVAVTYAETAVTRETWCYIGSEEGLALGQGDGFDADGATSGTTITNTLSPVAGSYVTSCAIANVTGGTPAWSLTAGGETERYDNDQSATFQVAHKDATGSEGNSFTSAIGTSTNRICRSAAVWPIDKIAEPSWEEPEAIVLEEPGDDQQIQDQAELAPALFDEPELGEEDAPSDWMPPDEPEQQPPPDLPDEPELVQEEPADWIGSDEPAEPLALPELELEPAPAEDDSAGDWAVDEPAEPLPPQEPELEEASEPPLGADDIVFELPADEMPPGIEEPPDEPLPLFEEEPTGPVGDDAATDLRPLEPVFELPDEPGAPPEFIGWWMGDVLVAPSGLAPSVTVWARSREDAASIHPKLDTVAIGPRPVDTVTVHPSPDDDVWERS